MHATHYLESLDSVRTGWTDLVVGRPETVEAWATREIEILFEVLVTLAYGREVVVPATYAFDSLGFLAVAPQVLASRDRAVKHAGSETVDWPFRPNLLPNERFDAVVATYLRAADGFTFVSSAFPELHGLDVAGREEVAANAALLKQLASIEVGANASGMFDRAEALATVTRELSAARPALRHDTLRMNDLLRHFAADSSDIRDRVVAVGDPSVQTYELLLSAVRQLLAADKELNSRSPVHSDLAWAKAGGRTIEEVAGGLQSHALLREFMDSLYNAVIFRSTPALSGTFSTEPSNNSADSISRVLAQNLAVIAGLGATALGSPTAEDETSRPGFRLSAPDSVTALTTGVVEVRKRIVGAIEAIFEDRLEPDGHFWSRVGVLDQALRVGGTHAEDALREYNEALAKRISPHIHANAGGRAFTLAATGFGNVDAILTAFEVIPVTIGGPAAVVGVLGPAMLRQGIRWQRSRAERRWWSETLATAVSVGARDERADASR